MSTFQSSSSSLVLALASLCRPRASAELAAIAAAAAAAPLSSSAAVLLDSASECGSSRRPLGSAWASSSLVDSTSASSFASSSGAVLSAMGGCASGVVAPSFLERLPFLPPLRLLLGAAACLLEDSSSRLASSAACSCSAAASSTFILHTHLLHFTSRPFNARLPPSPSSSALLSMSHSFQDIICSAMSSFIHRLA